MSCDLMASHVFNGVPNRKDEAGDVEFDEEDDYDDDDDEEEEEEDDDDDDGDGDFFNGNEVESRGGGRGRRRRGRWKKEKKKKTKKNRRDSSVSSSLRGGLQLKRSSLVMAGRRRGPSTPVPSWKLIDYGDSHGIYMGKVMDSTPQYHAQKNGNGGGGGGCLKPPLPKLPTARLSARKLAAALWEAHRYSALTTPQHGGLSTIPVFEKKEKEFRRAKSDEMHEILDQVWNLEEQHKSSISVVANLRRELDRCHTHLQELMENEKNHGKDMEILTRRLMEEKSMWRDQQEESIQIALRSINEELRYERKSRSKLENLHRKMKTEFHDVKKALSKALHDLERERKARELMEDVCDELAREVGEEKARVEELRRESAKVREEVEEERKMLHMAEIWREERVQMKMMEAKYEIEEKNAALDKLRIELETFLKMKRRVDLDGHIVKNDGHGSLLGEEGALHSVGVNNIGSQWKKCSMNQAGSNEEKTKQWLIIGTPQGLDRTRSIQLESKVQQDFGNEDLPDARWVDNADIDGLRRTSLGRRKGQHWLHQIVGNTRKSTFGHMHHQSRSKSSPTNHRNRFWSSLDPLQCPGKGSKEISTRFKENSLQTKLLEAKLEDHQLERLRSGKG